MTGVLGILFFTWGVRALILSRRRARKRQRSKKWAEQTLANIEKQWTCKNDCKLS